MKKLIYIKKLKFHNLFTGEISYKIHFEIFGIMFRVKYRSENPHPKDHKRWIGV